MKKLEITGGLPLYGEIRIQGSKNAVLPVLAACILGEGPCVIENCPAIGDVEDTLEILKGLGCRVERKGVQVTIEAAEAKNYRIRGEAAARIRSSILFLGALLGRMKKAVLPQPGGCAIGKRPIDLHISALQSLGVTFASRFPAWAEELPQELTGEDRDCGDCEIAACGTAMHGGTVHLPFPSVGATENLILACAMGEGELRIENAAREPEIDALCSFLNARGADIARLGDGTIRIRGVKKLHPVTYQVRADRIVTGTYLLAAAAAGGCIRVTNFPEGELDALLTVLEQAGGKLRRTKSGLLFGMEGRGRAIPFVETAPYPGFPTDLQSPLMAVCTLADGQSRICESIFENRFRTAEELARMGAEIVVEGSCAKVTGVERLHGAYLTAPDLRGGAALVIAALCADGKSEIARAEYIGRGYEDIVRDLRQLGARIEAAE